MMLFKQRAEKTQNTHRHFKTLWVKVYVLAEAKMYLSLGSILDFVFVLA